jgi:hypothetical protein
MVAANPNAGLPPAAPNAMPRINGLDERVRDYFDRRPECPRRVSLGEAMRREIHSREQQEVGDGTGRWATARAPVTAEDLRIHAWLTRRLAVLHYERHGLWPRLRRFLLGSRLSQWLRPSHPRNGEERD